MFGFIEESVKHEQRVLVVNLDSSQVTNLKSALKYINRIATTQESGLIEGDIRQSVGRSTWQEPHNLTFIRIPDI